ncbi:rRNA maturation RNase YbeY [Candidatus Falkowbacteria bacterium]|nr:rRNA maturation RNase YbeY [Candidatus Falkowbacteria bacterium]
MIEFEVNQRAGGKISKSFCRLYLKKLEKILKLKKKIEISIALVGDGEIKELNNRYRGQDKVTNVLSFSESYGNASPLDINSKNFFGEIIICYPQAVREAKKLKVSLKSHLGFLLVHGFLHLLGYDHKKAQEAKEMESLENRILDSNHIT